MQYPPTGPNNTHHHGQQVPPSSPTHPCHLSGPTNIGNWQIRRRRITYDAYGKLMGMDVLEETAYPPTQLQRGGPRLLWLLVLFLIAPIALPLLLLGLMLLGVLLSVLRQILLLAVLVVVGFLVFRLVYRLLCKVSSRP